MITDERLAEIRERARSQWMNMSAREDLTDLLAAFDESHAALGESRDLLWRASVDSEAYGLGVEEGQRRERELVIDLVERHEIMWAEKHRDLMDIRNTSGAVGAVRGIAKDLRSIPTSPPDVPDVLRDQISRLVEVLRPLAKFADGCNWSGGDEALVTLNFDLEANETTLTLGDMRRAAAVLAEIEGKKL